MRVRGYVAMVLAIFITANAVVMGAGVLCIELGGHTLVERIFDCIAGSDRAPEKAACDSCVDIPLQTTGDRIKASRASAGAAPLAHGVSAAVVEHCDPDRVLLPDLFDLHHAGRKDLSTPAGCVVLRC